MTIHSDGFKSSFLFKKKMISDSYLSYVGYKPGRGYSHSEESSHMQSRIRWENYRCSMLNCRGSVTSPEQESCHHQESTNGQIVKKEFSLPVDGGEQDTIEWVIDIVGKDRHPRCTGLSTCDH